MILVKFWLHISTEEQLKRFKKREKDPLKSWKLTDEDWRNREKRPEYEQAVEDMVARTSIEPHAPWHLIPADSKRYARVAVIETVIAEIEEGMRRHGMEPPDPIEELRLSRVRAGASHARVAASQAGDDDQHGAREGDEDPVVQVVRLVVAGEGEPWAVEHPVDDDHRGPGAGSHEQPPLAQRARRHVAAAALEREEDRRHCDQDEGPLGPAEGAEPGQHQVVGDRRLVPGQQQAADHHRGADHRDPLVRPQTAKIA